MTRTLKCSDAEIDELAADVRRSRKYRSLDVADETIHAVLRDECSRHRTVKRAVEEARRKLHHIVADYLGDPDYDAAEREVRAAVSTGDAGRMAATCLDIASTHSTSRERLAFIDEYYARVFALTGRPRVLLDLACGLNPVFLPWMDLAPDAQYHAYEIRARRVDFLNRFFAALRFPALAKVQDVIVRPPVETGDVALLLQEAHRMEQRRSGATRILLDQLQVRFVVVSLPIRSLSRRHDLTRAHTNLFNRIVADRPWAIQTTHVGNELIFCIDKSAAVPASG